MKLTISNIQTCTLHDGPGVRTTLFLAGCPLRCSWCHNPEAQSTAAVLLYDEDACVHCGSCADACPSGGHAFDPAHQLHRERCLRCGACVDACPAQALQLSTRPLCTDEYDLLVQRQQRLVGTDGGITFSGGEPLMQGEALLHFIARTPIHTAVETCGYAEPSLFRAVVQAVDYVMMDLKLADDGLHRRYIGVSNLPILKNLEILRQSGKPYLLRTPLIPHITDTPQNLHELAAIVGDSPWEKLPYNPLTPVKYKRMGKSFP